MARARSSRIPLIAVHRGTAGGTIFSNTANAAKASIASGGDMVELDVARSKDGVYFTFHDTYEPFLLGESRRIGEMTSAEIENLVYHKAHGLAGGGVEKFAETLAGLSGVLVNVDRSYRYWKDGFLDQLARWGNPEHLLIKSDADPEYLESAAACSTKFPFMGVVRNSGEIESIITAAKGNNINLVGFEILAAVPHDPVISPSFLEKLHSQGFMVWLNAINLENGVKLCAGYDDFTAVRGDMHESWGELVRRGADIIQTDWPWLLRSYLDTLRR
ncbi:glycerophosphodiester phosphodiesterase family protein [Arcanobacterium hippocoleae]